MNAVELERNGWFFFGFFLTFIEEILCFDWKEHRQKNLQIELVTKYDTKDALKEILVGGSKSAKGGPYPLAELDRGGPNPLWHRHGIIKLVLRA